MGLRPLPWLYHNPSPYPAKPPRIQRPRTDMTVTQSTQSYESLSNSKIKNHDIRQQHTHMQDRAARRSCQLRSSPNAAGRFTHRTVQISTAATRIRIP